MNINVDEKITQCIHDAHYHTGEQTQRSFNFNNQLPQFLKFVILPVLLLIIALYFRHFVVFLAIAVAAGFVNYLIHASGVHLHLGHVTFLNVLFSYQLGWEYGIAIIIIAHVLPEIIAGHIDTEMIVSGLIYGLIALLASIFSVAAFIPLAMILLVIQTSLSLIIGIILGTPFTELLTEHGVEHVLVMIWYVQFSTFILRLLI